MVLINALKAGSYCHWLPPHNRIQDCWHDHEIHPFHYLQSARQPIHSHQFHPVFLEEKRIDIRFDQLKNNPRRNPPY